MITTENSSKSKDVKKTTTEAVIQCELSDHNRRCKKKKKSCDEGCVATTGHN